MSKYYVATWSEEFSGIVDFDTELEANAYMAGYSDAANGYAAGKASTYLLNEGVHADDIEPDDLAQIQAEIAKQGLVIEGWEVRS